MIGDGVGVGLRKADDELKDKLNAAHRRDQEGRLARRADHQVVPRQGAGPDLRQQLSSSGAGRSVRPAVHSSSGACSTSCRNGCRTGSATISPFWLGYLTNGKHLTWYASVQYTLVAAVLGALVALLLRARRRDRCSNSRFAPLRLLGSGYINIVRGVPDVLFFLFFPLAFEQGVELIRAQAVCTPETLAAQRRPVAALRRGQLVPRHRPNT